jgi:hypothetical protein
MICVPTDSLAHAVMHAMQKPFTDTVCGNRGARRVLGFSSSPASKARLQWRGGSLRLAMRVGVVLTRGGW